MGVEEGGVGGIILGRQRAHACRMSKLWKEGSHEMLSACTWIDVHGCVQVSGTQCRDE